MKLLEEIRQCTFCADSLPDEPRPILQMHPEARILIAGQAPGRITREKGIPFDDASGNRLRDWMGLTREQFYDERLVAVLPMAFCFPGRGSQGDKPPPAACAERWRDRCLDALPRLGLTLVIGQYALDWHLGDDEPGAATVTQRVSAWRNHLPDRFVLPHPSPRNIAWFRRNPWFEKELLPVLRSSVEALKRDV